MRRERKKEKNIIASAFHFIGDITIVSNSSSTNQNNVLNVLYGIQHLWEIEKEKTELVRQLCSQ